MSVSVYLLNEAQDLEWNVANGNWARICDLLGVDLDWTGKMEGAELEALKGKVVFALESLRAMPELDEGKADEITVIPGFATVINCGLRAGYFVMRLEGLLEVITRAQGQGTALYWS